MRLPALPTTLTMVLLLLIPATARPQKSAVFGASADLVLIDLIATDADGRFVTDLRADEIEVLEDGKRLELELLQLVSSHDQTASPAAAAAAPLTTTTPAAETQPTVEAAPLLVVVVDLRTLPLELLVPVRDAIVSMARGGVGPGTRLMLVVLDRGLEIRQAFTEDIGRFVAAVEGMKPSVGSEESALSDLVDRVDRLCDGTPGSDQQAAGGARAFVEDVRQGLTNTTEGIGALARYLAPIPGRKHVVFYSAGYPMQPQSIAASVVEAICYGGSAQGSGRSAQPAGLNVVRSTMQAGPNEAHTALRVGASVDSTGMLHALLDEANRSQVSVYTVDARGLVADAIPGSQRVPTRMIRLGNAQHIQERAVRDPQEILYSIADGTGGTASINTNDMARGMLAAARDSRHYYLIGYAPPSGRKEGRFYPIEVKVSRPGLHLRYRRGYEWLSDAKRAERAIGAALRYPGLYAEQGLAVEPWIESGKLNVAVMLATQALVFRNEGGQYLTDVTIQGLLRDEQGKPVGDRYLFSKSVALKLPEDRYRDLLTRENVEIANQAAPPKPGRYQLTVVARHSGGRLASAVVELAVP